LRFESGGGIFARWRVPTEPGKLIVAGFSQTICRPITTAILVKADIQMTRNTRKNCLETEKPLTGFCH
jgi:hypothetical protein